MIHPVRLLLPFKTVNRLNERGSWHRPARRAARERGVTRLAVMPHVVVGAVRVPCVVVLTRCSPGSRPMDGDGLVASCKHIRDGIADALGVASSRAADTPGEPRPLRGMP